MEAGACVTVLKEPRYRNERKRILCQKWLQLGRVQIFFDATRDDVAVPDFAKNDPDYWIAVETCEIYTSHIEGPCKPPNRPEFQFSVPWDAIHCMYSVTLRERHVWLDDVDRSAKRIENRKIAATGRPMPS